MARRGINWGSAKVEGIEDVRQMFEDCKRAFSPNEIQNALMPAARIIRNDAKRRVAYGTGHVSGAGRSMTKREARANEGVALHLRDSIFATKGRRGVYDVIAGVDLKKAPHAHLVEFGTKPHWITPRPPKRFLRLFGKVFLSAVHHPGAKKKPFLRPAVTSTRGRVVEAIQRELAALLGRKMRPVYGPPQLPAIGGEFL